MFTFFFSSPNLITLTRLAFKRHLYHRPFHTHSSVWVNVSVLRCWPSPLVITRVGGPSPMSVPTSCVYLEVWSWSSPGWVKPSLSRGLSVWGTHQRPTVGRTSLSRDTPHQHFVSKWPTRALIPVRSGSTCIYDQKFLHRNVLSQTFVLCFNPRNSGVSPAESHLHRVSTQRLTAWDSPVDSAVAI